MVRLVLPPGLFPVRIDWFGLAVTALASTVGALVLLMLYDRFGDASATGPTA